MNPLRATADPNAYVVVTIPRSLAARARVAIAGLYQPFFVEWAQDGIVLVTRAAEWERVAGRFPGAVTQAGFRLLSLAAAPPGQAEPDRTPPLAPADLATVVPRLEQSGVRVRALRSFYRDHLLVTEGDLPASLEALALLGVTPDVASDG